MQREVLHIKHRMATNLEFHHHIPSSSLKLLVSQPSEVNLMRRPDSGLESQVQRVFHEGDLMMKWAKEYALTMAVRTGSIPRLIATTMT